MSGLGWNIERLLGSLIFAAGWIARDKKLGFHCWANRVSANSGESRTCQPTVKDGRLTRPGRIVIFSVHVRKQQRKDNRKMADNIMEIQDSNFETEVLKSDKPVMVDFWAPWCAPCKAIGPTIDELAKAFGDKMKFAKCNVDDNPVTPGKYGIKAIPTLIFFRDGEVTDQITGMVQKSKLEDTINNMI